MCFFEPQKFIEGFCELLRFKFKVEGKNSFYNKTFIRLDNCIIELYEKQLYKDTSNPIKSTFFVKK